ncbi:anti-sigma factor [Alphaproteobacteria bacterium]|nr:anti-sigma factor [Alphaproteobacteria bacterium]
MTNYSLHNEINTDRAWQQLYTRLEQDGLLTASHKRTVRFPSAHLRWAAAILVLCIGVATFTILNKQDAAVDTLMSLQNEKGAVTLVATLEDGSIVYLADDTRLDYPEHFQSDKREVSLRGQALFDVTSRHEHPFVIETELALIEVIGTAFDVQSTDRIPFELSVQRGEVKVVLKQNGQTLHVKNGETARLVLGSLKLEPTTDPVHFSHYTERIRFKGEKLTNILRVINNRGGNLSLQTTPVLENREITVTFADNDTPESIAELICTAFHLKCNKQANDILLISEP